MSISSYDITDSIERRGASSGLPVVLSNDFGDMFQRLMQSQQIYKASEILVQIYASWIVHNVLWENAEESYYVDMQTGREYELADDAHTSRRPYLRYRSRRLYKSRRAFFSMLNEQVPFFNTSTFMDRHGVIMSELRVWAMANEVDDIPEEMFIKVCEDVLLHGKAISYDLTQAFFAPCGRGQLQLRDGAPIEALGIDPNTPEDELESVVAKRLSEVIAETHDEIRSGAGRNSVSNRIRRQILALGTVTSYVGDNGRLGIYYEPVEIMKDGISILEPAKRYIVKIFDEEGNELLPRELEDDVAAWLRNSFRIPGPYPRKNQPWETKKPFL